jgi:hypothetical protein
MKTPPSTSVHIPLVHALAWIIGSALLVAGITQQGIKLFLQHRRPSHAPIALTIQSLVQTGPQREGLKTEYLAELMGISADFPPLVSSFSVQEAEQKLLAFPLIAQAQVKLLKPNTLYVDYTVRQPIAWLGDYENVALDRAGYPFPFRPFFSPKNLPEIYLGLGPFGSQSEDLLKPTAQWGHPLTGKSAELAMTLLQLLGEPSIQELFTVKRIDLSKAFAESYGTREIVLFLEDVMLLENGEKTEEHIFPKILRLSTKNYANELGNYLKLRPSLLEKERAQLKADPSRTEGLRHKEMVIDFRIPNLAFIDDLEKQHTSSL